MAGEMRVTGGMSVTDHMHVYQEPPSIAMACARKGFGTRSAITVLPVVAIAFPRPKSNCARTAVSNDCAKPNRIDVPNIVIALITSTGLRPHLSATTPHGNDESIRPHMNAPEIKPVYSPASLIESAMPKSTIINDSKGKIVVHAIALVSLARTIMLISHQGKTSSRFSAISVDLTTLPNLDGCISRYMGVFHFT